MSASKYKVLAISGPVGDGISGSIYIAMSAVAKKANAAEPNIVINELFCNLLARALFLPAPPGALLENGGEDYFCSLDFNLSGQALPPTPIPQLVSSFPRICWGILLFDVLVMNPDRHHKNLSFDRTTSTIQIFDHSRAFLPLKETIDSMMAAQKGKLGFDGHCLKNEINSTDGFDLWVKRIKSLPDYVIEETVAEICTIGFPVDKKSITTDFIKSRRDSIDSIVNNNIAEFPKLPKLAPSPPTTPIGAMPPDTAGIVTPITPSNAPHQTGR